MPDRANSPRVRGFVHAAAALCLPLHALALAGSQAAGPETVYRQYLDAYKTMRSLDDRSFEIYLSKTAQQKLAEFRSHPPSKSCNVCPSPEQELRMAKTMRPYPGSAVHPVRTESGGIVTLSYTWREPPGSLNGLGENGTDVSVKVEFVQEQGWKLKSESWTMVENPGTATADGTAVWSY